MTDPKKTEIPASPVIKPQNRLVAVGRLRRDFMILDTGENAEAVREVAERAVRDFRVEEAFTIQVQDYFTAAARNVVGIDEPQRATVEVYEGVALNPHNGPQPQSVEELTKTDIPEETVAENRNTPSKLEGNPDTQDLLRIEPQQLSGEAANQGPAAPKAGEKK
jgi:hypothetical protein